MKKTTRGFTLVEMLIVVTITIALAAVVISVTRMAKSKAQQALALQKLKSLGTTFSVYVTEKNGALPHEDVTGTDDWVNAAKPENQEAWYNALPKMMGSGSVGEIGAGNPARFYEPGYPLYVAGAPYPAADKRLGSPIFAVGMNSRLQRKGEDGEKMQGRMANILDPAKTVIFLERGLPNDKKTMSAQRGFDGSPKANARAFAARHNQKGVLVFADGHAEVHLASDLLTSGGAIVTPQTSIVWTMNPEADPN